jgi:hypothetical protein
VKKWQNLAPPDDENSWYDVNGVWPTPSQSYETIQYLDTGTAATATGTGDPIYAWCANTLSSRREYVLTSAFVWQYAAGAYTDRTGGVTIGSYPFMAQYGDVSICAMGASTATVKSTGGNFSALAGAPQAEIVLPVANALLYLNTNTSTDGWAASDVGDYTNYATGEAASGRLIQTPGPITAGVSFGNYAIVFKGDAIYRLTYVGGVIKWTSELLYRGIGCQSRYQSLTSESKYMACSGAGQILFCGFYDASITSSYFYLFDGTSQPRRINPVTTGIEGRITFNPTTGLFSISAVPSFTTVLGVTSRSQLTQFYSLVSDAWGKYAAPSQVVGAGSPTSTPLLGDFSAFSEASSTQVIYDKSAANNLRRYAPGAFSATYTGTCYLQSHLMGAAEQKTLFSRLIANLRVRTNGSSAVASLSAKFYPQKYRASGAFGGASQTLTPSESSSPDRFDFTGTDNFAQFKVTYTDIFVEIDDFLVFSTPAGKK